MVRLRTFKRLGAHAHREFKSPRDLQKARGGRSDPRASDPKPATSGRVGKLLESSLFAFRNMEMASGGASGSTSQPLLGGASPEDVGANVESTR